MKVHTSLKLAALAVCLASCASPEPALDRAWVPNPEPFPPSSQLLTKASKHWAMVADDIVAKVKEALDRSNPNPSSPQPIYIAAHPHDSVFEKAFRTMLITRLVERGVHVRAKPQGALLLQYESQLIRQGSARGNAPRNEVIVTSGIAMQEQYILRTTDVFYVEDADAGLYARARTIQERNPLRGYRVSGAGQ